MKLVLTIGEEVDTIADLVFEDDIDTDINSMAKDLRGFIEDVESISFMRNLTEGGIEAVEAPVDDEENKSSTNSSNIPTPLVSVLLRGDEDTEVRIATPSAPLLGTSVMVEAKVDIGGDIVRKGEKDRRCKSWRCKSRKEKESKRCKRPWLFIGTYRGYETSANPDHSLDLMIQKIVPLPITNSRSTHRV